MTAPQKRPSVTTEDYLFLTETMVLGSLVEEAKQTLIDVRDEGFPGLDDIISELDALIDSRRERTLAVNEGVMAMLDAAENGPYSPTEETP